MLTRLKREKAILGVFNPALQKCWSHQNFLYKSEACINEKEHVKFYFLSSQREIYAYYEK